MGEDVDGFEDVIGVHEGFAHAHEDEIDGMRLVWSEVFEGKDNLLDDFGGGEIAAQTERCRGAKGAIHSASDLGGKAKRDARGFDVARHANGFDTRTVTEFVDDAGCAVGRLDRICDSNGVGVIACAQKMAAFGTDGMMRIFGGTPGFLNGAENMFAAGARG